MRREPGKAVVRDPWLLETLNSVAWSLCPIEADEAAHISGQYLADEVV